MPEAIPEELVTPKDNKIVSIIIPTYNMADTITKTITSCLAQTYPYIEVIVINDGSTDRTYEAVKPFLNKVKYIRQDNMGTAQALNRGIKESIGQYISWLSADDYYIDEQAVSKRVKLLEDNQELDFVHSYFTDVVREGNVTRYGDIPEFKDKKSAYEYNKKVCWINGSTLLMRRKVIYNIGLFNYNFRYLQDWDYWFRLLNYHKGTVLKEFLVERGSSKGILAKEIQNTEEGAKLREKEVIVVNKYLRFIEEQRPTICAMICMKNEEDMIETCLDDLIQWLDKIVIFNDGSKIGRAHV